MWIDGVVIGVEKASDASLGIPNFEAPNLAPDAIITNFTFGTFDRATPSLCIPGIAAVNSAPLFSF